MDIPPLVNEFCKNSESGEKLFWKKNILDKAASLIYIYKVN